MSETRPQTPQGKRPTLKLNFPAARPIAPAPAKPAPQAQARPKKGFQEKGGLPGIPKKQPPPKAKPITTEEQKQAKMAAKLLADRRAQQAAAKARRVAQQALLAQLQAHAPALFDPANPKPLAVGIGPKLRAALSLSHRQTHGVLAWWTRQRAYQVALAAGGARYGLDGSQDGEISADEQATAQARLGGVIAPVPDAVAAAMDSEPGELPDAVAAAWDGAA